MSDTNDATLADEDLQARVAALEDGEIKTACEVLLLGLETMREMAKALERLNAGLVAVSNTVDSHSETIENLRAPVLQLIDFEIARRKA